MTKHDGAASPLTLRQNVLWTLLGSAVYAGSQWGMLTVMAKLGSPEMVGQFALATAICTPVFMLTNLQLRNVQATDAKSQYTYSDYLSLRILGSALAWLVIVIVTLAASYNWEGTAIILGLGLAKGFESVSDVSYGQIQKHERMNRIAISIIVKGVISLLAFGGLIQITGNLLLGVLGLAVVWLIVLTVYDLNNARQMGGQPVSVHLHLPALRRLTVYALPLGVTMMLASLAGNIPRYFIEHFAGTRYLGYFSAMVYPMTAGTVLISALGQSGSPRLSKYYALGNKRAFRELLFRFSGLAALIGLGTILAASLLGRQILTLLYRPDYAAYLDAFAWMAVASSFQYVATILGSGMTAAHYFRVQAPLFAGVAVVMGCACFLLVPTKGLVGAAQAVSIASLVQFIASLAVSQRIFSGFPEICEGTSGR